MVLVGMDRKEGDSKLLIFKITDQNELSFKHSIMHEENLFRNILFYPTTSILITVSQVFQPLKTTNRFIQYWDIETRKCLYEALIDDGTHENSYVFGTIRSISIAPTGENIVIATYYPRCTIYKVPGQVAFRHAKSDLIYRLFLLQQSCESYEKRCGVVIPKEIRRIIAQNMFLD